jgi:hypothetical protein
VHEVVIVEQFAQALGKPLRIEQVEHTQGATRDLVLVGRADALAGGADLASATNRLARHVERLVMRQYQRATLAHFQSRAHLDAAGFEALDFRQQVAGVEHHTVADITGHTVAHDA